MQFIALLNIHTYTRIRIRNKNKLENRIFLIKNF
nr:MAG TPA: hypothetical protein [Caudoviricetes sp.]